MDYEIVRSYRFLVRASDSGLQQSLATDTWLSISIKDVNDCPVEIFFVSNRQFPYNNQTIYIHENTPIDNLILGYIPQRKYQLGNRYRVESDACLSATKAVYEKGKNDNKELRNTIANYPKTQSLNSETVVKHFLDFHRAYNPNQYSKQSKMTNDIKRSYQYFLN